jgi:regulator of sirC expression with transglutaminase-like and TPR domain
MAPVPDFAELAASPAPALDLLALSIAVALRPPGTVDADAALAALDALGRELAEIVADLEEGDADGEARACRELLGTAYGFHGDREEYDHPDNSMLDLVLERRRGLPILLSVVYAETARRADVPLAGVGLPGHFVVGHFGAVPPLLLDPFDGGGRLDPLTAPTVSPWVPTEIAMRMLNNLVGAYRLRRDLVRAVHAAELRLLLPADDRLRETLAAELRSLQARMN